MLAIACALMLTACGGGGSPAADTPAAASEKPADKPTAAAAAADTGASTGPEMKMGANAFYFAPTASYTQVGEMERATGGKLFAAWNPNDPKTALQPGMKITFFGAAQGCPNAHNGALVPLSDEALAQIETLTGIEAKAAMHTTRWTPSGNSEGCEADAHARDGASAVFLNAANGGAVGLFTTSGPQADGKAAFFGPYDTAGQNGVGANAHITGTFVNFRQSWSVDNPIRPWADDATARVRSVQSMGSNAIDTPVGQTAQGKQQMMATFLNRGCAKNLLAAGKPCQIQYLFNTAVVRGGVSDWSQVAWFQNGAVWFDPGQGGIPIVDGPIKTAGSATLDETSKLELFRSQGSASQHQNFKGRTFDVTIDFPQLMNAVRLSVAASMKTDVSRVADSDIAAMWGDGWNDRTSWVLLAGFVGQEVYNPDNIRRVQIAGGFRDLFVGAQ